MLINCPPKNFVCIFLPWITWGVELYFGINLIPIKYRACIVNTSTNTYYLNMIYYQTLDL